ncbi:maltokinase N-terminal cap-like domain-containing protein [Actinomadura rupiterrae]|uniref:maltokinase N-terminal cap-like domain-containing protein n=1 Tax=Actinomadura rupiterrae TaxID=559627 RepID=UPI0020A54E29|nr:phosphotransferase [Actinomadura rupiterrae]MCP2339895.1 maltokinase [Actinomadura rupiterrae]
MRPSVPSLADLLAEWLPAQRWFAGKDRPIREITIGTATALLPGDPGLHHLVLDVRQDGEVQQYQLLLGLRRDLPERIRPAEVGWLALDAGAHGGTGAYKDAAHAFDAAHDPELARCLLTYMADNAVVGPLRFRRAPGVDLDTSLMPAVATAEQSNTSLIFGDEYICKLFRKLSPGVNPDLEVNLALTKLGCAHVPGVYGWVELEANGSDATTLALLSEYLRTGTDGWKLAVTSVRDWFAQPQHVFGTDQGVGSAGGDFAAEAERLGEATATVHQDLAEAFGRAERPPEHVRTMAARMRAQLERVRADVPDIEPFTKVIGAAFAALAEWTRPLPVQRVHGDYHLGQVMRTESGWVLLDFEGEPARSPDERREASHPLRDVAGMLRSFEYAARFLHTAGPNTPPEAERDLEQRARAWVARNRAAFCRGYASAGGPDPGAHETLLRALEFDKAVYEVRYEAANRPSWLPVPLRSLAHLTE